MENILENIKSVHDGMDQVDVILDEKLLSLYGKGYSTLKLAMLMMIDCDPVRSYASPHLLTHLGKYNNGNPNLLIDLFSRSFPKYKFVYRPVFQYMDGNTLGNSYVFQFIRAKDELNIIGSKDRYISDLINLIFLTFSTYLENNQITTGYANSESLVRSCKLIENAYYKAFDIAFDFQHIYDPFSEIFPVKKEEAFNNLNNMMIDLSIPLQIQPLDAPDENGCDLVIINGRLGI